MTLMAAGARTPSASGWTAPGTRSAGPAGRRRQAPGPGWMQGTGESADPAEARQWARAQGTVVNDRGRVPAGLAPRFKALPPDRLVSHGHQSHGGFTHMPNRVCCVPAYLCADLYVARAHRGRQFSLFVRIG